MRSRDAWLTLFAAALGVDAASCQKQATQRIAVAAVTASSSEPVDANVAANASVFTEAVHATKPVAPTQSADEKALVSSSAPDSGFSTGLVNSGASVHRTGVSQRATGSTSSGTLPKPPSVDTTVSIVSGEQQSDKRIVASLRAGMRACFVHELSLDPTAWEGQTTFFISILLTGDVTSVTMADTTLTSDDMMCISRILQDTTFSEGSDRTLVIKVVQKKT